MSLLTWSPVSDPRPATGTLSVPWQMISGYLIKDKEAKEVPSLTLLEPHWWRAQDMARGTDKDFQQGLCKAKTTSLRPVARILAHHRISLLHNFSAILCLASCLSISTHLTILSAILCSNVHSFFWPLTYWPFPYFHLGFIIANLILYLVAPSVHCTIDFICIMTRNSKRIFALNYAFFKFSKYFSIYIFCRIRARIN